MADIKKAVDFMVKIANDNSHGYDQTHRNGPDYDCSSLVSTALSKAGFSVSPYSWTGNLKNQLFACGFVKCTKPWKAGDIHLNEKHHVCMSINEKQIAQASINEKGGVTGGQTGDQTGKEIYIRDYYEYWDGWDIHLRYAGKNEAFTKRPLDEIAKEVIEGKWLNGKDRKLALESSGYNYDDVMEKVNNILKGRQSAKSINQIAREVIRGKWGNGVERKRKLEAAGYSYLAIQKIVNQILKG